MDIDTTPEAIEQFSTYIDAAGGVSGYVGKIRDEGGVHVCPFVLDGPIDAVGLCAALMEIIPSAFAQVLDATQLGPNGEIVVLRVALSLV